MSGKAHKMPGILKLLLILLLMGLLAWAGLMAMVAWKENHLPEATDYDAIVVLGAQVQRDGSLSVQLQWRLDAALEAYEKHPALVVCCGGQGADEPAPEGEVMRNYLIEHGIPGDRVVADTESANTRQNLRRAIELLGDTEGTVCIVTSDYHLPRALAMAADEGMKATGIPAPTKQEYWLKNHAREAIAWVKYWTEKYLGIGL